MSKFRGKRHISHKSYNHYVSGKRYCIFLSMQSKVSRFERVWLHAKELTKILKKKKSHSLLFSTLIIQYTYRYL